MYRPIPKSKTCCPFKSFEKKAVKSCAPCFTPKKKEDDHCCATEFKKKEKDSCCGFKAKPVESKTEATCCFEQNTDRCPIVLPNFKIEKNV